MVPDNPRILARFPCRHCIEVIQSKNCIAYVLKYPTKDSDTTRGSVRHQELPSGQPRPQPHPGNLRYCRRLLGEDEHLLPEVVSQVTPCAEAFAYISGDWAHQIDPTVIIDGVHLPGKKHMVATNDQQFRDKLLIPSPLERYLDRFDPPELDPLKPASENDG